jgi:CTP:molybdopterin cytidylyltransferase MocA
MRVGLVLLAAGEGRRMGAPKALLRLGEASFAARALAAFERAGVHPRVVVLGAEAARVAAEAALPPGARLVLNGRWRDGMLTSVWAGLDTLGEDVDAVLLHPVDNPLVESTTVAAVLAALEAGAAIAVPSHAGRRGHPAGFARAVFPALRAAPLSGGARHVLADHPDWVVHVPAGADCLVDVDTPDDLARVAKP